jgi:predicted PurR-regulated permease PerM
MESATLEEDLDQQQEIKPTPEQKSEPPPKIQPIQSPRRLTAIAVTGLFVLALFYTFYFAREFFLPLTLAWLLSLLLKPIARGMKRMHIPEALGAGILLLGIAGMVVAGVFLVSEPASAWLANAPATLQTAGDRVKSILRPAQKFQKAATEVEKLSAATADTEEAPAQKVELKKPGLMGTILSRTTGVVFLISETLMLLYFFLASGDLLMLKTVQILPTLTDKKRALEIAREIEQQVSRYLGSISMMNTFEGTLIGIGLGLIGMPNPVMWGVIAALVNYIPYLGAIACCTVVTIVALVTFESVGHALLAPAIYLGVNFADNFISPLFLGKRLTLNPLIVFLCLMFWGWIWGIVGVLLAVPLTMAFKIFCDHFKTLAPLGELLAGEPPKAEP